MEITGLPYGRQALTRMGYPLEFPLRNTVPSVPLW
jgi:hypothetical protein